MVLTAAAIARAPGDPIRLACVGDSITEGVGAKPNGYVEQLAAKLGDKWKVGNFGRSARTMLKKGDLPYWATPNYQQALAYKPDIVTIMLGTNDTKPQNWKSKGDFEADVEAMIDAFAALESKPKVILCLPPWANGGRWGINEKTIHDEVLPMLKNVAKKKKVKLIDNHATLHDKPDTVPDTVHPNADGARMIAENMLDTLHDVEESIRHPNKIAKNQSTPVVIPEKMREQRTWTAKSGTTITAKLVSVNKKTIALQTADGKQVAINYDSLSEADQTFLSDLVSE